MIILNSIMIGEDFLPLPEVNMLGCSKVQQGSRESCSPWGPKESDTTEQLN